MLTRIPALIVSFFLSSLLFTPQQPLRPDVDYVEVEKLFSPESRLAYNGYVAERLRKMVFVGDHVIGLWEVTFLHNGEVIQTFPKAIQAGYARFGLFPLLGRNSRELVVEHYSGGAHCCFYYWIYELGPEPVLLYRSEQYPVGYGMSLRDLDQDGTYEIEQSVLTFDYFLDAHVGSPFPTAVFKYEPARREYLPANRLFGEHLLSVLDEQKRDLSSFKGMEKSLVSDQYLGSVLKVLLTYLYAAEEEQGWRFFDKEYQLEDKQELKEKIRARLRGDRVYLALREP